MSFNWQWTTKNYTPSWNRWRSLVHLDWQELPLDARLHSSFKLLNLFQLGMVLGLLFSVWRILRIIETNPLPEQVLSVMTLKSKHELQLGTGCPDAFWLSSSCLVAVMRFAEEAHWKHNADGCLSHQSVSFGLPPSRIWVGGKHSLYLNNSSRQLTALVGKCSHLKHQHFWPTDEYTFPPSYPWLVSCCTPSALSSLCGAWILCLCCWLYDKHYSK